MVREAALLELELCKLQKEINDHFEGIFLDILKNREKKEIEIGCEFEGNIERRSFLGNEISEEEYFQIDMKSMYNGEKMIEGASIIVKTLASTNDYYSALLEYNPISIIILHPSLFQIRAIECFCAIQRMKINVHQLFWQSTIEDYEFIKKSNEEKSGFEFLLDFNVEISLKLIEKDAIDI